MAFIEILDIEAFLTLIFYVLTLFFVLYSIFLVYHWHSYGTSAAINTFTIAVYLTGSALIFLTMGAMLVLM